MGCLPDTSVPFRYIGELDGARVHQRVQHIAEHMVDARHFLQEEHPAVIASHIAAFAADVAQPPKRATSAAD